MPVEDLFLIREIAPEIPEQARIFRSVQCAECGEMVAEHRARVKDGKFVCIPCPGEYHRQLMDDSNGDVRCSAG